MKRFITKYTSFVIEILIQTYCGFSKRAKSVLGRYLGWGNFKVVEIDELADGEAMYEVFFWRDFCGLLL